MLQASSHAIVRCCRSAVETNAVGAKCIRPDAERIDATQLTTYFIHNGDHSGRQVIASHGAFLCAGSTTARYVDC